MLEGGIASLGKTHEIRKTPFLPTLTAQPIVCFLLRCNPVGHRTSACHRTLGETR